MASSRILVTALAVALGWTSTFSAARADDFTIAERGKSASCSIELPAAPTEVERYAAEELRDWTEKLTGVRLPIGGSADRCIRIVRGTPDLGDDGFRLTVRNGSLEIGGNRRGSLYGVYEILERFGGIGWFSSLRTVVPECARFAVPGDLDDLQVPAFAKREILWRDVYEEQIAARFRSHGHWVQASRRTGGRTHYAGGGQEPCNTLFSVLKRTPGNTFKDHPEYYSEVRGQRVPDGQLCLSNPDVIRIYTQNLLDIIRSDPTAPYFVVSIEDRLNYCTCPKCKAIDDYEGSPAGSVITFVNKVTEAVVREFPHVRIISNAYLYTRKPPLHVKPHPSVLIQATTIEADMSRPIAVGKSPGSVATLSSLKGWRAIAKDMCVWDYTTDYVAFLAPFPNVLSMQANIQLYRDLGISGCMMQGDNNGAHADFAELKAWLLSKWLWNPDRPIEPLLDRFFTGYYGAAAPYVRQYFDELHALPRDEMKHPLLVMHELVTSRVIPDSFLKRGRDLWARAADAVRDDPEISYLVRMGALTVDYTILARSDFAYDASRTSWDERDLRARRALARSVLDRIYEVDRREGKKVLLAEGPDLAEQLKHYERIANGEERVVCAENGRLVVPAADFDTWGPHYGTFVEDEKTPGGKAYSINLGNCAWSAEFPFAKVRFEPDCRYRIRVLVSAEKIAGAEDVPTLSCGVIDRGVRKSMGRIDLKASEMKDGSAWYDVCSLLPGSAQSFWIGVPERDKKAAALRSMKLAALELSLEGVDKCDAKGQSLLIQ